jgi:hypothetical protein
MFNKIDTVVIKFAKKLDLELTYDNKALFNSSNIPSGVKKEKKGNLLTLDFSAVDTNSKLYLNEKYLSCLELIDSSVKKFSLNEKHNLKEFNLLNSRLHIQELYKEKIKFKLNASSLTIDTYLISQLETFGSFSEVQLGKGYIFNLIKGMSCSSMTQNKLNGLIVNIEQLFLNAPGIVKLNVINKCNYLFVMKGFPRIELYGNPKTMVLEKFKNENETEKLVSRSSYKKNSNPELIEGIKKEMPIHLELNKEKILNWSDKNSFEAFETDLTLYIKNKSHENILTYNIFDILNMNKKDDLKVLLHNLKKFKEKTDYFFNELNRNKIVQEERIKNLAERDKNSFELHEYMHSIYCHSTSVIKDIQYFLTCCTMYEKDIDNFNKEGEEEKLYVPTVEKVVLGDIRNRLREKHSEVTERMKKYKKEEKRYRSLRSKKEKEEQKSEELKKDIILVREILGMDYPTDGITEENRSIVLSVLENKQMKVNSLTDKESENLKKLNFMFDIKSNKTTAKF